MSLGQNDFGLESDEEDQPIPGESWQKGQLNNTTTGTCSSMDDQHYFAR
jgi:hypothetical protein